jgi:hypothetical protein
MNVSNFIEKYEAITANEDAFLQKMANTDDNGREAILTDMHNDINELIVCIKNTHYQDSVVTVKDYCDARKVSRQYVYQEIKKGKFKTIELPIFTEYQGKRIEVGHQKFLSF